MHTYEKRENELLGTVFTANTSREQAKKHDFSVKLEDLGSGPLVFRIKIELLLRSLYKVTLKGQDKQYEYD